MALYFAYGSNLLLSQIRERLKNPNLEPCFVAYSDNKKLFFPRETRNQKGGVASYTESQGHKLWGAVFDLTHEEITKLDIFEGYKDEGYKEREKNNSYNRIKITVTKIDGSKENTETYIATEQGIFLPSQYYIDKILRGGEECGLPKYYIEELKHIETNGIR